MACRLRHCSAKSMALLGAFLAVLVGPTLSINPHHFTPAFHRHEVGVTSTQKLQAQQVMELGAWLDSAPNDRGDECVPHGLPRLGKDGKVPLPKSLFQSPDSRSHLMEGSSLNLLSMHEQIESGGTKWDFDTKSLSNVVNTVAPDMTTAASKVAKAAAKEIGIDPLVVKCTACQALATVIQSTFDSRDHESEAIEKAREKCLTMGPATQICEELIEKESAPIVNQILRGEYDAKRMCIRLKDCQGEVAPLPPPKCSGPREPPPPSGPDAGMLSLDCSGNQATGRNYCYNAKSSKVGDYCAPCVMKAPGEGEELCPFAPKPMPLPSAVMTNPNDPIARSASPTVNAECEACKDIVTAMMKKYSATHDRSALLPVLLQHCQGFQTVLPNWCESKMTPRVDKIEQFIIEGDSQGLFVCQRLQICDGSPPPITLTTDSEGKLMPAAQSTSQIEPAPVPLYGPYGIKKVRVELYRFSKCPDGMRATNAMKQIMSMLSCFLDFHIYMMASVDPKGKYGYWSMHGDEEVYGDMIYLCSQQHYYKKYRFLAYIFCMDQNLNAVPMNGGDCARILNIDWVNIQQCANGDEGRSLMDRSIQMSMLRGFDDSPTMYINGMVYTPKIDVDKNGNKEVDFDDMMLAVCSHFDEEKKPTRCTEWLRAAQARTGRAFAIGSHTQ